MWSNMDKSAFTAGMFTLLGVFLGFILNWLAGVGKLKIYITEWWDDFQFFDNKNKRWSAASRKDQVGYYVWNTKIDFYNSSNSTKIMRDMKIVFMQGKKITHIQSLKEVDLSMSDELTGFFDVYRISELHEISILNIPPKTLKQYHFANVLCKNRLNDFLQTTKIILVYKNGWNRQKKKLLSEKVYSSHFADLDKELNAVIEELDNVRGITHEHL